MSKDFFVDINMNGSTISGLPNPVDSNQAATKNYVDSNKQIFIQQNQPDTFSNKPWVWYQTDANNVIQTIKIFDGVL